MTNIVVGLVALCLGIWGLITYRWYTVDVIIALFPLVLLIFGLIAVLAGIKNTGIRATLTGGNKKQGDTGKTTKTKDV